MLRFGFGWTLGVFLVGLVDYFGSLGLLMVNFSPLHFDACVFVARFTWHLLGAWVRDGY